MDYKSTLNLPRTDFPMQGALVTREPDRLKKWKEAGLYERMQAQRAGATKFVLHDGPPFANGDVHIGTALNKILKDFVVKYKTLRGFNAPYIPGWDCHGLPIEFKVSQEMRKAGDTASDAVTIRKACEAYAWKYINVQREQFKRLGILGDWDNPYLTLNKEYEAEELRLFADIVEQGFVYRGKKPVYWSIPCRTALAEAEVEYKDHTSQSVYVKFPIVGRPGVSVVIWTTTPWTLPANLAVAYNSTFSYSLVRVGDEEFIVSAMLLSSVAEKGRWASYEIVRSLDGGHLSQFEYQHPFCNRTGKFFAGDGFVDNETGTGFVHIAPGHGLEDYNLGLEHGLPIYSPVDDDGRFTHTSDLPSDQQMPAGMLGKLILEKNGKSEANDAVLEELTNRKALLHQEAYHHSYPHCWRSKTPIIFRAMDQWFINIDHTTPDRDHVTFRTQALEAIDEVKWIPDWGKNRIEAAVKSRPDWCISRQRTWGVPIPAFYDAKSQPILDAQIVRATAALIEKHGSNIWFEKSATELWSMLKPADWRGAEALTKSNDTLDVWIDSGSSSRAVIARREEIRGTSKAFQADMYLEGSDQHRGWFQSSLLLSLAGNSAAPYRMVLTHGFMVKPAPTGQDKPQPIHKSDQMPLERPQASAAKAGPKKEKVSKSDPTAYEKPQTSEVYVNEYGADVVRLWVASQDFRNDIVVSKDRITKVAETYRVIRNALRYQLSNLFDFDPARDSVDEDKLTGLDRWILSEFGRLEQEVAAAYDDYEFHVVYQKISQFVAVELSAIYHDVVKDRLYTDAPGSPRRRSTQTALHRMVVSLCKMLAPMLSFTADEAWEFVPGKIVESVHQLTWQPMRFSVPELERSLWQRLLSLRESALSILEQSRQSKTIGKALEAQLKIAGSPNELEGAAAHKEELRELLNVSGLSFEINVGASLQINVEKAAGKKCERCWHWEIDVGAHPEHPTICGRCVKAIDEASNLQLA